MKRIRQDEPWYDFFYTELTTGLRRGEICGLKWEDFDAENGKMKVRRSVAKKKGGGLNIGKTKTETGTRTIVLPLSTAELLQKRKETVDSDWMFPSPTDNGRPRNPSSVRKRLQLILERVGCKKVRFHDLRHTFATMALEHGMDVKTLSATIGHVSSATTLDIYSHITDTMQRQAAVHIDRKIGGTDAQMPMVEPTNKERIPSAPIEFTPYKPKICKPGTGCVTMINDRGWYTPANAYGKRESHKSRRKKKK